MSLIPIIARSIQRRKAAASNGGGGGLTPVLALNPEDYSAGVWSDGNATYTANNQNNITYSPTGLGGVNPGLTIANTYLLGDAVARGIARNAEWMLAVFAANFNGSTSGSIFENSTAGSSSDSRIGVGITASGIVLRYAVYDGGGSGQGVSVTTSGVRVYAVAWDYSKRIDALAYAVNSTAFSYANFYALSSPPKIPDSDSLAVAIGSAPNATNVVPSCTIGRFRLYRETTAPDPSLIAATIQSMLNYYSIT